MPRKLDSDSQIGRRLTLRDLHLFFTVAQHGSMAKAASQLGISQPSVSEVIAHLEQTLGARLFDRRPRGVETTMYGEALLTRTRAVFDELRQGIKDIELLGDPAGGEVRIGCAVVALSTFLRPVIDRFSEAFPGVVLRVANVPAVVPYTGLRERRDDVLLQWCTGLFSIDNLGSDVKVEFLFDDPLVVVAGPRTRWASRRKIDLADLVGERWILGPPNTANSLDIMEAFRKRGLPAPNVAMESLSVSLRTYLLATGRFITAMPRSAASQSPVKILPVDLPDRPRRQFAVFTLKDRTVSPVVDRFIAHLRDFARSMPKSRAVRASHADFTR
jgi:DNA-binding transcriptional LysR family regulator